MTAGPTFARVLGRLAERRFAGGPDTAYFEAVIDALRHAYAERLESHGRCRSRLADVDDPRHGGRSSGLALLP